MHILVEPAPTLPYPSIHTTPTPTRSTAAIKESEKAKEADERRREQETELNTALVINQGPELNEQHRQQDGVLAGLVDMGFTVSQAQQALNQTEVGQNLGAAAEWLLAQPVDTSGTEVQLQELVLIRGKESEVVSAEVTL